MRAKTRGNGQGTAYKRGRSWTAQVVIGWRIGENGRSWPVKRTKNGFATKREALEYCPTLLAGKVARPQLAPFLREYWETYKKGEYAQLSRNTQSAYRTAWNKLTPLHDIRVDAITVDMLRSTVSEACPTFDTAKDCKSVLGNLFALAAADRFADRDLPSFIVLPKHKEKERIPFNEFEQAALWRLYESGDRRAALPLLMIYTGMMPGEAHNLRVENIDLASRTITHVGLKTETRKATPIVLAAAILPLVADLIDNALPSGYIWPHDVKTLYRDYYAAIEAAGCRRLTPYSCRHTTATALAVTEGVAPQTVRKVMRWSTTKMLDRYAHPETSDALNAVDQI